MLQSQSETYFLNQNRGCKQRGSLQHFQVLKHILSIYSKLQDKIAEFMHPTVQSYDIGAYPMFARHIYQPVYQKTGTASVGEDCCCRVRETPLPPPPITLSQPMSLQYLQNG